MSNERPYSVSRRSALKATGVVGLASVAGCLGGDDEVNWVMGTSEQGSSTFSVGQAIESVLRDHSDQVNVSAQASGGHSANARELGESYDVAMMSNWIHHQAVTGTGPFEENPADSPGFLGFSISSNERFMVTTEDSDIETYDDLRDRTIATYASASASHPLTVEVFEELGIQGEFERQDLPLNDYASALDSGRVEAVGGYTLLRGQTVSGGIQDLINQVDLKAIEFSDDEYDRISHLTSPEVVTVEPEPFDTIDEVTAWADGANVVFGEHLDDDLVTHTMEVLFDNWDELLNIYGGMFDDEGDNLTSQFLPDLPVHPGAAEFLESDGRWDDEWTIGE